MFEKLDFYGQLAANNNKKSNDTYLVSQQRYKNKTPDRINFSAGSFVDLFILSHLTGQYFLNCQRCRNFQHL